MEQVSIILGRGVFFLIELFLIVYILKHHSNSFVKGILVISFILSLLTNIIISLAFYANIESLFKVFFQDKGYLNIIQNELSNLSYFLLLFGLSFLFGKSQSENNEKKELIGVKRNIWISLLLFIITLGLYFPFWLYRTVKDLRTNFKEDISYTPGQAVGYLFIPVFNVYWIVYLIFSLPKVISKIETKYFNVGHDFYFKPALISILMLLLPIVSNVKYFASVDSDIAKGVLYVSILIFDISIVVLYLTLQAKINGFYDHNTEISQ